MYAQIVVLTYQSSNIDFYTYKIPENLKNKIQSGSLVTVPFGRRKPYGVIISLAKTPPENIELKEIENVILENFLVPHQIKLLSFLKNYFLAPAVNCLEAMLPPIPKKIMPQEIAKKPYQQTLILVPNINSLPEVLAKYPSAKNHITYHNELKMSERFSAWQNIYSGNYDFIFSTRSGIFTPFPNLKNITIYDEHDEAYKDERSPYYDTLTITEKISALTGAKLEIVDSSPKLTTYFAQKEKIRIPKTEVKTKIISMEEERTKGNNLPLADYVIEVLKRAQIKNKSILVFLNKKQKSGYLYCKSCKYQQFTQRPPEVCPNCKSTDFWFNSTNVFSQYNLIRKIIPGATVRIITKDTQSPLPNIEDKTIDIATASIFYDLPFSKYDVAVHVATDSTLNITNFTSAERAYWQITSLKNRIKPGGLLILQTFNPNNPVITFAKDNNYLGFFHSELNQRQLLKYPPYALLIKITIRGMKPPTLEKKSKALAQDLKLWLSTTDLEPITVLGPFKPIFQENAIRFNILLKVSTKDYSLDSRQKALNTLRPILEKVTRDFQIIVEPNNLS